MFSIIYKYFLKRFHVSLFNLSRTLRTCIFFVIDIHKEIIFKTCFEYFFKVKYPILLFIHFSPCANKVALFSVEKYVFLLFIM